MAWITTAKRTTFGWNDVPDADVPTDREMKSTLVHRLKENPYTEDASIRVEVTNRVAILVGEVETPVVKRVAGEDAWDIPGIVDVSNQLTVAES